ncbi:MAG: ABC transporter permease [Firmicutes bacterium]|nr:ABC transporter permease [Bacillota bacterium]
MSIRVDSHWTQLVRAGFRSKLPQLLNLFLRRLFPYLFLLAFWQLSAWGVQVKGAPFPTPIETFSRAAELLFGANFLQYSIYQHIGSSLLRWGIGFILAAIAGLVLGILATLFDHAYEIIIPITALLQPVPSLAWIPLAILLLGLGPRSTVFIIFLAGLFPVIINVTTGIKSVPLGLLRAGQMMGAKQTTIFLKILLPGSLPHLLSGLRTALANGWRALIAAEMVGGSDQGLGYAIFQSRWSLDYPSAFVAIIIIAIIGLVIERGVFRKIEAKTVEIWGMSNRSGC